MRRSARLIALLVSAATIATGIAPGFAQVVPAPGKAAAALAPDGKAMPNSEAVDAAELQPAAEDPPILVGRVARSTGTASFRLPGAEEWQPAALNTTLVAGTGLWTEPGARLAVEVAQSRLFLEGDTAVQLDELDDDGLRATIAQGTGFLRLQGVGRDDGVVQVATPEGTLATVVDGRYLVEAADSKRPGRFAVFEGVAEVTPAGGEPVRLAAGEALVLAPGAAPQRMAAGGATPLMAWALGAEPRRPLPAAVQGMTGAAELAQYGSWGSLPEYGQVWYPPVQQGWQPYRDGNWVWRDPWGWTWVDAAPWGYAPAHYGRWVQVGPRWAWAPQPVPVGAYRLRPAWAPALVAFFGGVAVGGARPVGWVPLAPREPFYPWYRASPRYVQRVNYRQVPNVTVVRNTWVERGGRDQRWDDDRRDARRAGFDDRRLDGFRNRQAAIQVPERVMLSSQPVRGEARRLDAREAARAEPVGGLPPRPAPETRGVTMRSAERLGLPPAEVRAAEERRRGAAPPPQLRAALDDRRRDEGQGRRAEPRDRQEPPRDLPQAGRAPEPPRRDAPPAVDRQALRERLQQPRDAAQGDAARQRDGSRPRPGEQPRPREDAGRQAMPDPMRRQPVEPQRQPPEQPRRQQDEAAPQRDGVRPRQQDQTRQQQEAKPRQGPPERQQPDEGRRQQDQPRQQQDDARRQQEQMRQQQEQGRRQQDEARQQQEQARRQQDQSRQQEQMRQQQQDQARRQQEQMRQQQQEEGRRQQDQSRQQEQMRQQQQDQARRQQEQMRQQQQEQGRRQQEQARQQQEQARRQQDQARQQQQEHMRQQQQEQARRQQDQARQQQQEQMRQQQQEQARRQQDQARQQQQEQARRQQDQMRQQQQAEQRRQR